VREPARSGAFRLASPYCPNLVARNRVQAAAVGFRLPLFLPAGGRGCRLRRHPGLDRRSAPPCGTDDLDQLVCDGKTLRGSIEPTSGGGSTLIAQVTLYSASLGVAIAQACYSATENHENAVLQKLLGELDLKSVAASMLPPTNAEIYCTAVDRALFRNP